MFNKSYNEALVIQLEPVYLAAYCRRDRIRHFLTVDTRRHLICHSDLWG
jgi:hypothetical protein